MILDSADSDPTTQNKRVSINSLATAGGESNTTSNEGTGNGLALPKSGINLPFKSLITNAPIATSVNTNDLTFSLNPLTNADIDSNALIEFSKLDDVPDSQILVGSNLNKASAVPMSGDATITNTGILTIGNDAITDDKIATHTTTKITTDNKSLLNSNIVYTDQANFFGGFTQRFENNRLKVLNNTQTASFILQAGPITLDRTIILPALDGNDTFVFQSFAQSLTDKTLVQPTIADFVNANHDHSDAAGGGQLTNSALTAGNFPAIEQVGVQTDALDMGSNLINNVTSPASDNDAATKIYVDDKVSGLSWKNPAILATTANITLSGEQIIDGILTSTDRVLVKDQTSAEENGVYLSDAGAWGRTADADSETELTNMSIFIQQGTTNADTSWVLTTDPPIVVDTTELFYAQVSGGFVSPLNTKGDIFGYDTGNARIPVGTDGQVLTANSAVGLGVSWEDAAVLSQTPWVADIDADEFDLLNLGFLEENEITEPADPAAGLVRLWSEEDAGFSTLKFKGSNGFVNTISEDAFIAVRNITGVTIPKGKVVYVTGAQGQRVTVDLAKADSDSTMRALGFVLEDILNNSNGFVIVAGSERNVDTSAFTQGDSLYVSATTAGEVTTTIPTHPNISQLVGIVLVSNASTGEVSVVPGDTNGQETGTNKTTFKIGDGLAGAKTVGFVNAFTGNLSWEPTAARTLTLPDATDTLVGKNTPDTFTLKIIDAASNTITNIGATEVESGIITDQASKATPVAADEILISDSAAAGALKKATLATLIGGGGSQTPWVSDINAAGFDLQSLSNLEFQATTGAPGSTVRAIYATASGLFSNVDTAQSHTLTIAGTDEFSVSASTVDLKSNVLQFADANTTLQQNATNLQIDVASGGAAVLRVNDVTEYSFAATEANFNSNNLIGVNYIETDNAITAAGGSFRLAADEIISWRNAGNTADNSLGFTGTDTFELLYDGTLEYEISSTQADWKENDLINVGLLNLKIDNADAIIELEANHDTPAPGLPIGRINFYDDNSVNARTLYSQILAAIDDATDGSEDGKLLLRATTAGSLKTYISLNDIIADTIETFADINTNGNNLDLNGGLIQFDDVDTQILQAGSDLAFDTATGGDFFFRINNGTEYQFSDTTLFMNANTLQFNVNQTITPSGVGLTFNVPTGDEYNFNVNSVNSLQITSSVINAGSGKKFQENGTNISPIGKHDIWLDAGGMIPVDSGAIATRIVGSGVNQKSFTYVPFVDASDTFAVVKFKLPRTYDNGTITAVINWTTQTEAAGDVVWGVAGVAVSDGANLTAAGADYGTEVTVTDTQQTINFNQNTPRTTSITIGGTPADSDTIFLRIRRLGTNGSDTFTQDAQLLGVYVELTTDAAVSA